MQNFDDICQIKGDKEIVEENDDYKSYKKIVNDYIDDFQQYLKNNSKFDRSGLILIIKNNYPNTSSL